MNAVSGMAENVTQLVDIPAVLDRRLHHVIEGHEALPGGDLRTSVRSPAGVLKRALDQRARAFSIVEFHVDALELVVRTGMPQEVVVPARDLDHQRVDPHTFAEAQVVHPTGTALDAEQVVVVAGTDRHTVGFLTSDRGQKPLLDGHLCTHAYLLAG